jgi:hypothetical protein
MQKKREEGTYCSHKDEKYTWQENKIYYTGCSKQEF